MGAWSLSCLQTCTFRKFAISSNLFETGIDGDESSELSEKLDITAISCSIVGGEEIVRLQAMSFRQKWRKRRTYVIVMSNSPCFSPSAFIMMTSQ